VFLAKENMIKPKVVVTSVHDDVSAVQDAPNSVEGVGALRGFRADLRGCLTRRGDGLFEVMDAMLCAQGPVRSPVELSMEPEFRRGHGSVYDALAHGRIDTARLRRLLTGVVTPSRPGQPLMFAVDTTPLARPDAEYADQRVMVQLRRKGGDVYLPGWHYSLMVGLHWGSCSWVDPVQARRIRPSEDPTALTLTQVNDLLADLAATAAYKEGDPPPLVIFDAGYDATALAHELSNKPVQILVRLNTRRVFYTDPAPRQPGTRGPARRHGQKLSLTEPANGPAPDRDLTATSPRYGTVQIRAWHNMHQELGREGHWAHWPPDTPLPIVRGTVIQVSVEHLPDGRTPPKDLWLFHAGPCTPDLDLLWKAYLRRFDQEHFHRFLKVHLGLGAAHLTSAAATDRWVQLTLAAYAQLRQASTLVHDLRRPWHPKPQPGTVLTPYRTRLGFRRLRAQLGTPTHPAKFSRPGPGRPKGSTNRPKAKQPPYRKTPTTTPTP
jgi:DDE superfamily endonuclease